MKLFFPHGKHIHVHVQFEGMIYQQIVGIPPLVFHSLHVKSESDLSTNSGDSSSRLPQLTCEV